MGNISAHTVPLFLSQSNFCTQLCLFLVVSSIIIANQIDFFQIYSSFLKRSAEVRCSGNRGILRLILNALVLKVSFSGTHDILLEYYCLGPPRPYRGEGGGVGWGRGRASQQPLWPLEAGAPMRSLKMNLWGISIPKDLSQINTTTASSLYPASSLLPACSRLDNPASPPPGVGGGA